MRDLDELLRHEIISINMALPKRAIRLSILLQMNEPYVETLGGDKHYFDKQELEILRKLLPTPYDVALPIVFIKKSELGEGVYLIRGGKEEVEAFKVAVGVSEVMHCQEGYYTYKPLVLEFFRRFKTLGVIGTL